MSAADVIGYSSFMDDPPKDPAEVLTGGGGLLTHNGIKKPAYHAFAFLSCLQNHLICVDEQYAITTDKRNTYSIICHNYRRPGYRYFADGSDCLDSSVCTESLHENERLRLRFRIRDVENGNYALRRHCLNEQSGNIRHELALAGAAEHLQPSEIRQLARSCAPRFTVQTERAVNNTLSFDVVLESQEVQLIRLSLLLETQNLEEAIQ
jgi:beta-xylosidase